MAFKLRSSGPFKMMGSSPVYNGQKTEGKIKKKTFIGPTKPMIDKDNDGIPAGVDMNDTPGGKQSNPPKRDVPKRKPTTRRGTQKKKSTKKPGYSDKKYDYKSTDFLKTDYASEHGVGDLTTIKRLNKQNQKKGKDYKDN